MSDQKTNSDTRERILDVAERLFMENGYEATSMRTITSVAEVNLAAVNYHFGSKEALLREVFRRRLAWLNHERCRHSTSSKSRLPERRSSRRRSSKPFSAPCCAWVRIQRWVA
jgi:AcrR family transcriptional regulator